MFVDTILDLLLNFKSLYRKFMKYESLQFNTKTDGEFIKSLQKKVRLYFKENNISRHANASMVFKTIALVAIYLVPYFLMLFGVISNPWIMFAMWLVMGIGMAGVGFSVMHDANHGSYSKNQKVNNALGQIIKILGGSAENWRIQHNVLHHSYTNIDGMDEDIDIGNLMRFSPTQKRLVHHRFQHIYAWFLYGLMTFLWSTSKDFKQLFRYQKMGLIERQKRSFSSLLIDLIISKLMYFGIFLVLPLIFFEGHAWQVILGYAAMHYTAGIILSTVFQPAHVIPDASFPEPELNGQMDNNWAVHQVLTTSNFAPESRLFSWYVGGLNYQIEHHLFPNICHVHYKKLSEIVKETTKEYGLPYYSQKTFFGALKQHGLMLKNLGKYDNLEKMAA